MKLAYFSLAAGVAVTALALDHPLGPPTAFSFFTLGLLLLMFRDPKGDPLKLACDINNTTVLTNVTAHRMPNGCYRVDAQLGLKRVSFTCTGLGDAQHAARALADG